LVKLSTKDNEIDSEEMDDRAPLDLVCVIDRSGSMHGEKWDTLVETMTDLLDLLQDYDRLSVVSFDSYGERETKLLRMNKSGKQKVKNVMKEIGPRNTTNILSGIEIAMKVLSDRKYKNTVTSVFLLGDGLDDHGHDCVAGIKKEVDNATKSIGSFTIHTFGFGEDHDSQSMTDIANMKDGSFYYIENI